MLTVNEVVIVNTLVLATVALSAVAAALASLGQANGVGSAANSATSRLAYTANGICGALQGFTEEACDGGHFLFRDQKILTAILNPRRYTEGGGIH